MKFSKSKIFVGAAVSFALGILLASRFSLPRDLVLLLLALLLVIFALSYVNKFMFGAAAALFFLCAGFGVLRLWGVQRPSEFSLLLGGKPALEGYIVEDVDIRPDKQLLTVQPKNYHQRILVTAPLSRDYFYGDWVVMEGKLTEAKNFGEFDYQKYLQRYDIYAQMYYPKILVLKSGQGNWLKMALLKIKWAFSGRLGRYFPEPENSLLLGILIGARKTLPPALTDSFNRVGLSHIVAISGYNIAVIIQALGYLAKVWGRRANFWLSLAVIAAFVVLTGASASVMRAAAMGGLLLLSFQVGRLYRMTPAICAAALVMLIINPKILFWDAGFQLSFLATMGIVYGVPVLEKLTRTWPSVFGVKQTIITTLSATLATLPLILLNFGRLSVVALLANVAVLPLVPAVMLLGFLSVLPYIGAGLAFACHFLLAYILWAVQILSAWRWASLDIKISEGVFVLLCAIITAAYVFARRRADKVEMQ